jgi:ABC-type transport system involved in multi-copper enzyme maturation permease subunit
MEITPITVLIGFTLYFTPTLIASYRKKKNTTAIGVFNFFAGFTIIGWIICLVWALKYDKEQNLIVNNYQNNQDKKEASLPEKLRMLNQLKSEGLITELEY